ncbi:MAG TPA: hypothetical protein VJT67_13370 [Longimicrobiaceae bacterium]|nr:hypothetical protein [Longimicrobiaceae bacterium]
MKMTLAQFALAVNADRKWVLNAAAALGREFSPSEPEARRLGLARLIQQVAGKPLRTAYALAESALASGERSIVARSPDGSVSVRVDVSRYLRTYAQWLSRAYAHQPRRRGRPLGPRSGTRRTAESYGLDLTLIDANLRRPLAERLSEADDAAELMASFHQADP